MMNSQWMVETQGDPLSTVRDLITSIWENGELSGMILSINGTQHPASKPELVHNPRRLSNVNPFKPVMTVNAARLVPEHLSNYPDQKLGALLRPCEMRALIEMVKHDGFDLDKLTTICVDCLGTLPAEDYQWRANRIGSGDNLAQDALKFARQGGILAYRYRSACQMCTSPGASGADININVLGLPVRQQILIQARDEGTAARFQIEKFSDHPADQALIDQHERVLFKLSQRHAHTMQRLFDTLSGYLPESVDGLIQQLESCGDCQNCMDTCPICTISRPVLAEDGQYERQDVMRWLISCAGCGMCEQSCPSHLPLSAIFGYIREQLKEEFGYLPGSSPGEPLPLM